METIGEKILEIRKQKGLTQEELADRAKINLRTVQRIEKNETEPRGNTLKMLCNVLELLMISKSVPGGIFKSVPPER